jgi:hypothetical protein
MSQYDLIIFLFIFILGMIEIFHLFFYDKDLASQCLNIENIC